MVGIKRKHIIDIANYIQNFLDVKNKDGVVAVFKKYKDGDDDWYCYYHTFRLLADGVKKYLEKNKVGLTKKQFSILESVGIIDEKYDLANLLLSEEFWEECEMIGFLHDFKLGKTHENDTEFPIIEALKTPFDLSKAC